MPYRLKLRHVLGATVIGVLMTYQNCAQPPDNSLSQLSYQSSLPFAYSAKVDTIGYMSCSEIANPVETRAYFTFRVGAYNNTTGGLTLTNDFRTATQYYDSTQRGNALGESTLNSNTRLNLSLRLRSNMQSIYYSNGSVRAGYSVDSFLPPLDSPDIAGPLAGVASGRMINYFPGSGDQRLMEASLRFYADHENIANEIRNNIGGAGTPSFLVVGYSNTSDQTESALRVPASPVAGTVLTPAMAYGSGFSFAFQTANNYSLTGAQRVLSPYSGVTEYDLTTGRQIAGNWDCSAAYQFKVVRPEDWANNTSLCTPAPDAATAAQTTALGAIRRVLRVEDWFVDLNHQCVMPKRTGDYCYGNLQAGQSIQYGNGACVTSGGAVLCPHFVSVCIRR